MTFFIEPAPNVLVPMKTTVNPYYLLVTVVADLVGCCSDPFNVAYVFVH